MVEKIISRTFLVIILLFKTQHHPLLSREYPPFFDPREIAMLFITGVDKNFFIFYQLDMICILKYIICTTGILVFPREIVFP